MTGNESLNTTIVFLLFIILAVAVITDIRIRRIPNVLLFPALSIALLLHTLTAGLEGLAFSTGGLAIGIAMLLPLYVMGGMGAGDVKLLGVIGSFLGPWGAVVAGLATMMAGAVLGIAVILWHRVWPLVLPHALHLLGAHDRSMGPVSNVASRRVRPALTKIAYAPAVAVGTTLALWRIDLLPILI